MALFPPLYHGNTIKASPGISLGWFGSTGGSFNPLNGQKRLWPVRGQSQLRYKTGPFHTPVKRKQKGACFA